MDKKTWIIVDDRQDRILAIADAIKVSNDRDDIRILWMAPAETKSENPDFTVLFPNNKCHPSQNLEIPEDVEEHCILLLDLKWDETGAGQYDPNSDGSAIHRWLEKSSNRLAFSHSSGNASMNALGIAKNVANPRFVGCPGDTDDEKAIVDKANHAFANICGIDYSGIDFLIEQFSKPTKSGDKGSNHDTNLHWECIEKVLCVTEDQREKFYPGYWSNARQVDKPVFKDGSHGNEDPIYSSIKNLHIDLSSVSAVAAWFIMWGGMRTRLVRDAKARVTSLDGAIFDALGAFRELNLNADSTFRQDYVAGGFQSQDSLARCLKLLFRIGYDLVLSNDNKTLNFAETVLSRDSVEVAFYLKSSAIIGKSDEVVGPLCAALAGDSEEQTKIPTANRETTRALVALNTVLGVGGDGDISRRKFSHYFHQEKKVFRVGFSRLPYSRLKLQEEVSK